MLFFGITFADMDILPSVDIFKELQDIHDTGFFTAKPSLDDHWQQVIFFIIWSEKINWNSNIPDIGPSRIIASQCLRSLYKIWSVALTLCAKFPNQKLAGANKIATKIV